MTNIESAVEDGPSQFDDSVAAVAVVVRYSTTNAETAGWAGGRCCGAAVAASSDCAAAANAIGKRPTMSPNEDPNAADAMAAASSGWVWWPVAVRLDHFRARSALDPFGKAEAMAADILDDCSVDQNGRHRHRPAANEVAACCHHHQCGLDGKPSIRLRLMCWPDAWDREVRSDASADGVAASVRRLSSASSADYDGPEAEPDN